uniref:Ycf2 protein n=1 Tax=Cuscuta chinensis TaxID=267557 RepID=UPI0024348E2E|nr:Ycf2 protein [Cuscuta chinensis]YP_010759940.1 Ycf2 protein [Cuscuta chinensis]WEY29813.1 Ycf2 protein [Cuscuta chinensis]WEY29814.1 Ycf2 protein [Cuscuta chinensis]
MKKQNRKFGIFELREINKSKYFLDSWTQFYSVGSFIHIFFRQERFLKLFDPRILSLLLARNLPGSTRNQSFTIKGVIVVVVGILIYRMNTQNMVERKNLYLKRFFPLPFTHTNDQARGLTKMSMLLLSFPKGKTISENSLLKPKENTEVLPITKVRWRHLMENRIFHEMVAGIDILFKEKALQSLEFPFVYYLDDKDPNSESGFKILVKSWIYYLMPAFREKRPQEGLKSNRIEHVSDLFSRKGGTISLQNCTQFYRWQFHQDLFFHWGNDRPESHFFCSNMRLNKDRFFSKGRNIWSNLQSASAKSRSHFVQGKNSSKLKRSSDPPIDLFESLQNEDSEYSGLIHQKNIQQRKERASSWDPSFLETEREKERFPEKMEHFRTRFLASFCSERCSELYITSTPIERATKDPHFGKKPLCFVRRAEKREILHLFKIILYLQKTVSIHSFSSDPAKKNLFFSLVQRFYLKVEEILQGRADLWTLVISEPDTVYHKEFSFYLNSDLGLDKTKLLKEILNDRAELKKKSLWVRSPLLFRYQQCYPETNSFFKRGRQKMVGFVSKNQMKSIRQYQNDSSISFYLRDLFNRSHRNQIPREQKVTALLNYRTRMNYKIKQDYTYRYKWSNSIKSLQEQFEHFLSAQKKFFQVQKSRFEGTFEVMQVKFGELRVFFIRFPGQLRVYILQLRFFILEKWIYWSEVRKYIEKKVQKRVYKLIPYLLDKLSKAVWSFFSPHSLVGLFTKIFGFVTKFIFFWANSLLFYCVSLGNTPIQRSEIYIYELQGPTHKLCNQLLESIGFKMVHLKRLNPILVEESSPSNFVVNGAITSPNKLPIDSLHTRTKSFYKKDSDLFQILHDQENWLNPANQFQRSSLIYSFYKANRLRFLNNPDCFWFDCKTRFPFSVERTWNTHFNFLYGQFLNSLFLQKKIVSLCGGKKHIGTSSPMEAQVDLKLISQDFHSDPVIGRAIYSIIDTSATPLTETEIVNLERTSCQPFLDLNMNLSDSETKNFYEFPNFISKMGLSHSPYSESIHFDRKEKGTSFQRDSFFSLLSEKWNLFQRYLPSFFTLAGYKYINLIFSDLVSRVVALSWRILQIELGKMPFFITIESLRKGGFNNFILGIEIIHRNTSVKMFYLKTFFVIFVGYLITMHLFFVSRAFIRLHKKLKSLNSFMSSSSRIEVRKLLDKYPMSEPNDFWLKNLFSDIMTRIAFSINVRKLSHISHTSKDIYSLLRKRKNVNWEWIDDQIESWVANTNSIHEEESKFLVQLATLTTEKSVLLSLTHSDHLSKNDAGYQILEQPGALYFRDLVDIQQKHLMNYEFNTACFAERRLFLAHSQTITYSQWAHFPSPGKPFSLRLDLSPSRGSLVIGSIGTGRSYLVKTLATNSYLPFITIFVNKLLDKNPPKFLSDIEKVEKSDNIDPSYDIDRVEKSEGIDNEIGRDLATELDLLTWNALTTDSEMKAQIDRLSITLQFELARAMSPCIIWIPNIHDLDVNESNSLSLGLLVNQLSRDCARCSPRNNLVIASTHLPQKVDPALIAPKKLNTCIKLRRLLSSQQRKSFFTLSYTRGFHLEKKMFHTNGFGSITMGPNARDIVALTNEVLSISITQKKSIIDTNIIRSALHRQTWDLQSQVRLVQDHGILFYQIGRAVAQNVLISDCPIDTISLYLKKKSCNEGDSYLYKWYFELGKSMKKLTILLYILSCSAGSVAQDLWSLPGNNGITSSGLVENDSDLVHGLLEVEGALVGSSSILDQQFLYESEFEESPQQIEEDLLNHIVWAPRLWRPWGFLGVSYEENDSESGTMQYKTRDSSSKEIPTDPLFFLFKDQPPGSVFSRRELFADEEMAKALLTSQIEHMFVSRNTRFFSNKTQEKHFEFLIHRQKWLRTNSSLSNTLSESYQYLANLFLSNGTLLDQITKTLLRKRWLFPDEMKIGFM